MKYVYRDGKLVEKDTGEPLEVDRTSPALPQYRPDIRPYRSPIDGRMITTRHERLEDLKRNGCREVDPSEGPKRDQFRNPKYAQGQWAEDKKRM